ncbi:MAG TPA: HAD family hydrolase [Fimbriimonadaceae bacterium]|nr:HAD family hydrolase [Fimbriimonadaceae bacterium]
MERRPLFLDRDGVLNVDVTPYVSCLEEFQVFPFTVEALTLLDRAGFDLYVVSNQQGVAKGITPEAELDRMEAHLQSLLAPIGFGIRKFYYCKALKGENSELRKPRPGMVFAARDEFDLDLTGAFLIGDKDTDIECAKHAGLRPLLVMTGVTAPGEELGWAYPPEKVFRDLMDAAEWITKDLRLPT